MSFSLVSGVLIGVLKLLVRIQKWVMVKMSLNGKFHGSNGKVPGNCKLKKAKEPLRSPNCGKKWKGKFISLWILVLVIVGCVWFYWGSYGSFFVGKMELKSPDYCENSARILIEQFNMSKDQLQALASLLCESDQGASLRCIIETGTKIPLINNFACTLKALCCQNLGLLKEHMNDGEDANHRDQCPAQNENILWRHDISMLKKKKSLHPETLFRSHDNSKYTEGMSQVRTEKWLMEEKCETSSFCLFKGFCWVIIGVIVSFKVVSRYRLKWRRNCNLNEVSVAQQRQLPLQQRQHQQTMTPPKGAGKWRKRILFIFVVLGTIFSFWLFYSYYRDFVLKREETLANMCDERARMLQDQFNVSMNHVHALAILVSTFHHGKQPSAIDQKTFGEYTERTSFERPLTSGVAYALKVPHSLREEFEKQHGLTIKKMETEDQTLVQDCDPENLDPAPIQDEYAPVVFAQETVSHIISIDMMSGKEDRENILRARASGKGVLTSPFKLLKSNHLGVVLTFAVYDRELPLDVTPKERIDATVGYIGASYDVPSLVDRLLHQLASKQKIAVNVYDTTNKSSPINMYGNEIVDTGLVHISHVDFGDPLRKHEMHCRFKRKAPWPWTAIHFSGGALIIINLLSYILYAAINRIAKVEEDYHKMMELKSRAEAADVAKSQFLATVSHEIRTPMNGVLGMLQMLIDTDLDATQKEYVQTAHASGKDLISLINEVLDQAKIESGRLELEKVPFDLFTILDNVLSIFSGKSNEKNIELAVYVSDKVPEVVIGDPVRVRQIITNLVGNSTKFTHKGHILVSVHTAAEVQSWPNVRDKLLSDGLNLTDGISDKSYSTLSGSPVVDRRKSWENFKKLNSTDRLDENESVNVLITVEDTGDGIPLAAQSGIFTPFMQADSSTSRNYGGTGIGLSISKSLVDLMHGEIGFVSEPGIGSTFSFSVPFIRCERNSLDLVSQNYDQVVSDFRGLRALVIDKISIRAEVTRYHLRRLEICAETAYSLGTVCRQLSSWQLNGNWDFSMVLIEKDIWDRQTGLAFNSLLQELWKNKSKETPLSLPKIFLLATSIDSNEHLELKSAGLVDNVLMKPLRSSVLITCFQEVLGNGKKKQERKKPSSLGHLLKEKRILVVDDNMVNRKVAEGALKKYGAIVTCVGSGKEAIEKLCPPHDFDACFMDLQMPEMDGFEATRQIRAAERQVNRKIASGEVSVEMFRNVSHWHMPILAMTADVIHATNEECIKCGMDDYVSKPFEEEQLYSAVARFF